MYTYGMLRTYINIHALRLNYVKDDPSLQSFLSVQDTKVSSHADCQSCLP